jgi:hypothetical protein
LLGLVYHFFEAEAKPFAYIWKRLLLWVKSWASLARWQHYRFLNLVRLSQILYSFIEFLFSSEQYISSSSSLGTCHFLTIFVLDKVFLFFYQYLLLHFKYSGRLQ